MIVGAWRLQNGSYCPGARCVLSKMAIVVSIQNGAVGIAAAFWFQPVVAETAVMSRQAHDQKPAAPLFGGGRRRRQSATVSTC